MRSRECKLCGKKTEGGNVYCPACYGMAGSRALRRKTEWEHFRPFHYTDIENFQKDLDAFDDLLDTFCKENGLTRFGRVPGR
jgi:hypothetical protein